MATTSNGYHAGGGSSAFATGAKGFASEELSLLGSHFSDDDSEESESESVYTVETEKSATKMVYAEKTDRTTMLSALLVLCMWIAAVGIFLYVGVVAEIDGKNASFEARASEVLLDLESTIVFYERFALWVHQRCSLSNISETEFTDMYNSIQSLDVEIARIGWGPNISHDDRLAAEEFSRQHFEPRVERPYLGFTVLGPPVPGERSKKLYSDPKPFYFPAHLVEPLRQTLALFDSDLYQRALFKGVIDEALTTSKPVLTQPELRNDVWIAYLIHPGVIQPPRDISFIQVSFVDLMVQSSKNNKDSDLTLYLFDRSDEPVNGTFLGGAIMNDGNATLLAEDENTTYSYQEIVDAHSTLYAPDLNIVGRSWSVVITPIGEVYEADLTFILFGGGMIFLGSIFLAVWLYHNYRRSQKLTEIKDKAKAEHKILRSLFPEGVHSRLIQEKEEKQKEEKDRKAFKNVQKVRDPVTTDDITTFRSTVQSIMNGEDASISIFGSKPIADLFPDATIMFGDLAGFTAWSSVRDPAQVFTLLETIYHAFDTIATKRRVFKVETIGDCYVAVAGLPKPRKDHAVAMAKFATDCMHRMRELVSSLETTLGPETGELQLRVGLHSGEVTAGVLRGDKGRFQLFGDTMNTASRMESTGKPGRIQVSEATAQILRQYKKGKWLFPREDLVVAKGKGEMQTYWVVIDTDTKSVSSDDRSYVSGSIASMTTDTQETLEGAPVEAALSPMYVEKINRLVKWNVEVLGTLLKKIVARRNALGTTAEKIEIDGTALTIPLDEVEDIITLPEYKEHVSRSDADADKIVLPEDVVSQLNDYVSVVASMYSSIPFHNFEHASHVIQSVTKLLSRIVEPTRLGEMTTAESSAEIQHELHDHTFGITSDPLTQFACGLSALIHDVDHPGVPNSVFIHEDPLLANNFRQTSLAEQNSIEIGWQLLMGNEYEALRKCICCNQEEFNRFRQLIVNVVMATDIMDKGLNAQRKSRWDKAFSSGGSGDFLTPQVDKNRKATIVIEHIIQASDVAHTMQHWHIYAKWNERLFREMYSAFKAGRIETDPTQAWYEGEKGFFDFYIIPLAQKLDTCGVFGASSNECYNYAVRNREEWGRKGKSMVEKYVETFEESGGMEGMNSSRNTVPMVINNSNPDLSEYLKEQSSLADLASDVSEDRSLTTEEGEASDKVSQTGSDLVSETGSDAVWV